jgi:CheY-like chemotaxis protein
MLPTTSIHPRPPASPRPLRVAIFDDVVAARGELFHIPGLAVDVFPHADNALTTCGLGRYDLVFMDFAMGPGRKDGATAIAFLRSSGFSGSIIGISSDPAANSAMRTAGANDALASKAHLRSYLVQLGAKHLSPTP